MAHIRTQITTSWDDGHPADARLADLLLKHGFGATFYVPCRNREGRDVLSRSRLRTIAERFEIGSHTLDHVRLTGLSTAEVRRQVLVGKAELEQALGKRVLGFCYPGGGHNRWISQIVREADFAYARTSTNLAIARGASPFHMPTTIQFYPHSRDVYVRNFVRFRSWGDRYAAFRVAIAASGARDRTLRLAELAIDQGHYFHLWGHSWELEALDLWGELDQTLRGLAALFAPPDRHGNLSCFEPQENDHAAPGASRSHHR